VKCFVATAFGHSDVDETYDHVFVPVLRQLGIVPTRVDQHEHNDDIDDKIFELLRAADLCIADLTYARSTKPFWPPVAKLGKPASQWIHETSRRS